MSLILDVWQVIESLMARRKKVHESVNSWAHLKNRKELRSQLKFIKTVVIFSLEENWILHWVTPFREKPKIKTKTCRKKGPAKG